jgi:tRNA(Arg) A34 adenosine deaminase TadA
MNIPSTIHLALPSWLAALDLSGTFATDEDKMRLAVELSRLNVEARSGGPFGAAVFGPGDRLVAVGVNAVVSQTTSIAHAETMALTLAQQSEGRPRLNRSNSRLHGPFTLVASSQPCCQCYGATVWAGIDRLLIGARTEDVTSLTEFDEGPLPADWMGELARRGIEVVRDVCRDEARGVLKQYTADGGDKY